MENTQELFNKLAECLHTLSCVDTEVTKGNIDELVEMATNEQNNWFPEGPAWKLLQEFCKIG